MDDPLVRAYTASEREIAAEFLTDWLPFLSQDLCDHCSLAIRRRIESLRSGTSVKAEQVEQTRLHQALRPSNTTNHIMPTGEDLVLESSISGLSITDASGLDLNQQPSNQIDHIVPTGWDPIPEPSTPITPTKSNSHIKTEFSGTRPSWADMAQEEDELEEMEDEARLKREGETGKSKMELSREQKELNRFRNVKRNKDFVCLERVGGRPINIVSGLELHTGVFSPIEQKRIVDFVHQLHDKGQKGELGERTYSAPAKWMRGKGRVTMQFGCNYNYATDRNGNPPGIMQNVAADPMPDLFKIMVKRLLKWHVLPMTCIPDSCIVNMYEPGDCIPPHIDSHDFVRPFCTVSFVSECNIVFGTSLKVLGPGEFGGSFSIPLPVGSVLVLNGNGADVAKHCVPAVPTKRISITFRKMEKSKWPVGFALEPDLQNVVPYPYDSTSGEKGRRLSEESSGDSRSSNLSSRLNFNSTPNSNSSSSFRGGRRSRGKAPMIRTLYKSPLLPSTSHEEGAV
ncbi:2-oxoglutarate (2OG) and Fe(II)-dependent oxygenase superfamily protein [Rhynchospora pubera]|uniref:2-oxoglutarate (2OG) and Fe(II)-dependent oxygenase superfamily protein n=1 Tax=Rhynchospora pubera TaxID=906938 RepID=A0AAV8ES14_9POAL|nr:2-oxoglutarate (2OG) and Fe(II)-dependent oxygenase superfamily protein [Rhynchospora pubera]